MHLNFLVLGKRYSLEVSKEFAEPYLSGRWEKRDITLPEDLECFFSDYLTERRR